MAQGAAYTMLQLDGKDEYLKRMQTRPANFNPKYQRLLDLYQKGGEPRACPETPV